MTATSRMEKALGQCQAAKQGCERSGRNPGRLLVGRGMCPLPPETKRERTGAREQQGTALGVWERLWETPLVLQVNGSTTLGQERLPRGHSWRFRAALLGFISSRNGHLTFVFTGTLAWCSAVQPWGSVPIPNSALFGVTLQEREYCHNLRDKCFPFHSKAVHSDSATCPAILPQASYYIIFSAQMVQP